jgi:hypothetical protein
MIKAVPEADTGEEVGQATGSQVVPVLLQAKGRAGVPILRPSRTTRAVRRAAAAGIIIVACTGRWQKAECSKCMCGPRSRIFTLKQNLKQDGVSFNLALGGGSDRTLVTEGYAKKMVLRKLGGRAAVVGFAETPPTFGDVYEASLTERWGRQHPLEAVAVPWIYIGPAADSPWNLRTRFLQTYTPLSEELQQTGEYSDICIRADYWHLLPQYIKREMRDGLFYIYKPAFGCGYFAGLSPHQSQ